MILKTLAGYMNGNGGTLLIGVADDGAIVGLDNDYKTLKKHDRDGFEQALMTSIATKLGADACHSVQIVFHSLDNKEVCRVMVAPAQPPDVREGRRRSQALCSHRREHSRAECSGSDQLHLRSLAEVTTANSLLSRNKITSLRCLCMQQTGACIMFEDSLVESSGRLGSSNPWTAMASFAVQILLSGIVLLISLIYTEGLPQRQLVSMLEAPALPQPAAAPRTAAGLMKPTSEFDRNVLQVPREIPKSIAMVRDEAPPRGMQLESPATSSAAYPMNLHSARSCAARPEPAESAGAQGARLPGVAQGLLIREVKPVYPPLARQARIQGSRDFAGSRSGKMVRFQNLQVISGHPMLIQAAMEAVKQWRYKPYFLNGEPVEVDTHIVVNFTLSGG